MPRDLPLGNGRLLVAFDREYTLRELYWPHVGHESHVRGARCRFGVWAQEGTDAGGQLAWLHEAEWSRSLEYEPETLVTMLRTERKTPEATLTVVRAGERREVVVKIGERPVRGTRESSGR